MNILISFCLLKTSNIKINSPKSILPCEQNFKNDLISPGKYEEVEHESYNKSSLRFNDLGPMKIGEIKMFKIDPSKIDCKLNPNGVYYVKKEFVWGLTFFFASLDKEFKLNKEVTEKDRIKDRYISQAGYTDCRPGYIDYTETYDGTRGTPDIRKCGVGTVFATLCMVDPELNMLPSNGIDEEFKDEPSTARIIKKGCRKFIGLLMWSENVGGPYKNFNAALNTGLNKFLIPNNKDKYVWMDTERARSCYDPNTKTIGPEKIAVLEKVGGSVMKLKEGFQSFQTSNDANSRVESSLIYKYIERCYYIIQINRK